MCAELYQGFPSMFGTSPVNEEELERRIHRGLQFEVVPPLEKERPGDVARRAKKVLTSDFITSDIPAHSMPVVSGNRPNDPFIIAPGQTEVATLITCPRGHILVITRVHIRANAVAAYDDLYVTVTAGGRAQPIFVRRDDWYPVALRLLPMTEAGIRIYNTGLIPYRLWLHGVGYVYAEYDVE